nr:guanine nucleotide-binding protein subunit gamma 3 [Ipomoea batatas]
MPPPRPKSPPQYPDLYGKRRELARVQMLEREIGFLEDELKFVDRLHPASRSCKEVTDFVLSNPDPLIPTIKKSSRSSRFWKWLCGVSCFSMSWICCCRCPRVKKPSHCCNCNPCGGCSGGCNGFPSCVCCTPSCPSCSPSCPSCNCKPSCSCLTCKPSCSCIACPKSCACCCPTSVPRCPKMNCSGCTKNCCCWCNPCYLCF